MSDQCFAGRQIAPLVVLLIEIRTRCFESRSPPLCVSHGLLKYQLSHSLGDARRISHAPGFFHATDVSGYR